MADLTVEQLLQHELLECNPDLPLCKAAQLMRENSCSSIVIVEENEAVGIWTEKDALAIDFSNEASFSLPIRVVMSSPIASVAAGESMHNVALRFQQQGLRHPLTAMDSEAKAVSPR
ncbi:CBS domain-containing protein [Solemya pervernicosa gill symbiont]|uniref:CBS domain-containing protein n=1 Tax=Solemya pervernicosa gill symbiont TaxID=642797 RepID=UPI00155F8E13|nr:CBS domain-containing protein [Solemya pervernicosa gill symbiont]